jgi:ankyrin repeat protein
MTKIKSIVYANSEALMDASKNGHIKVVKALVKVIGNDINTPDKNGFTALMMASKNGHLEVVKALLAVSGIECNAVDKYRSTALIMASKNGHLEVVKALLATRGINVNIPDDFGITALIYASVNGYIDIVEALLAVNGIEFNAVCVDGTTALMIASEHGQIEIVEALLKVNGIDVNARDENGSTALTQALRLGYIEVAEALLAVNGIDVNAVGSFKNTALIYASRDGHVKVVKELLKINGIEVNTPDNYGETALMMASRNGHIEIVKALLAASGIEFNAADKNGSTALMNASENGQIEIVKELLKVKGIKVNARDENESTALMLASKHGHFKIAEILRNYMISDELIIQTCTKPGAASFIFKGLRNYHAIQCFVSSISILVTMQELRDKAQLARQVIVDGHELVLELNADYFDETLFSSVKTEFLNLTGTSFRYVYVPPHFHLNHQGFFYNNPDLKLVTTQNILRSAAQLESFHFDGIVLVDLDASPSILLRGLAKQIETFAIEPLSLQACLTKPAGSSSSVQIRLNNLHTSLESRLPRSDNQIDINVSRGDQLLSDSFNTIQNISNKDFGRRRFKIHFQGEAGIDAGGLTTEWYSLIMRELVNPHYALFKSVEGDQATFHINESSSVNPEHLKYFRMAGRLLAKGLYDFLPMQFSFTRSLQKIMLGRPLLLSDLNELDQTLVNSLNWIADNEIAGVVEEMTFSIDHELFGEHHQVDLKPNGSNILVNDENKFEYIRLVILYKLYGSSKAQIDAFLDGLYSFIPKSLLEPFSIQEWNSIISGSAPIDVDDWQRNTIYSGNYNAKSIQVVYFWRAVRSFTDQDRRQLLKFVTGTTSAPLEGFINLRSNGQLSFFKIGPSNNSIQSLPLGHTCFCSIDLPLYPTYEILREKLLTAIYEGDGAFLIE